MKTAAEREKHFRQELEQLLNRHGCEIVVTDDGKPYGMHSPVLRFEMDAIYDDSGSGVMLAEYTDFSY